MVLAAASFSLMAVMVKLAGQRLPAPQIVLVRVILTLALSWIMVRHAGVASSGRNPWGLVRRGLLGFCGLFLYYVAVTHIPLAEATTIHHAAPIVAAVVAAVTLGERMGRRGWFALLLGLVGTAVVARPTALLRGDIELLGVGAAVASAVFSGVVYATVRDLSRTEHPLVIVYYFPLVALPLSIPWAIPVWLWPTALEWAVLVGVAVATQMAQVFMTMGLSTEPAGRATAVGYIQVVFAALWGLAFGETPTWTTVVGACLVLTAVVLASTSARAYTPSQPQSA